MSNKLDNREEQRIEREAEKFLSNPKNITKSTQGFGETKTESAKRIYIAGATKEASRNKEDAIGFAEFAKNHAYDFDYKRWFAQLESVGDDTGVTTEELYNNYINQKV